MAEHNVYAKSVLSKKIYLLITETGANVKENIESKITSSVEGKCIAEGFIKPGTVRLVSHSSGIVNNERIEFQTVFECMICHPVEGMTIDCTSKTITKAGVHAQVIDSDGTIPVTVFIARDHHNMNRQFNSIKENSNITIKVTGVRYELNDPYICVLGKLMESVKPKLKIGGDANVKMVVGGAIEYGHGGDDDDEDEDEDDE
jgi:DNA-directed RNA polymerase subunit E'/Rpb7